MEYEDSLKIDELFFKYTDELLSLQRYCDFVYSKSNIDDCIDKFKSNYTLNHSNFLDHKENTNCKRFSSNFTSRNPFSLRKGIFYICDMKKSYN